MLITKKSKVTINSSNILHYKNLGYNCKVKDKILVDIYNLTKGSHVIIEAKCDVCNKMKKITYQRYLENIEIKK